MANTLPRGFPPFIDLKNIKDGEYTKTHMHMPRTIQRGETSYDSASDSDNKTKPEYVFQIPFGKPSGKTLKNSSSYRSGTENSESDDETKTQYDEPKFQDNVFQNPFGKKPNYYNRARTVYSDSDSDNPEKPQETAENPQETAHYEPEFAIVRKVPGLQVYINQDPDAWNTNKKPVYNPEVEGSMDAWKYGDEVVSESESDSESDSDVKEDYTPVNTKIKGPPKPKRKTQVSYQNINSTPPPKPPRKNISANKGGASRKTRRGASRKTRRGASRKPRSGAPRTTRSIKSTNQNKKTRVHKKK